MKEKKFKFWLQITTSKSQIKKFLLEDIREALLFKFQAYYNYIG